MKEVPSNKTDIMFKEVFPERAYIIDYKGKVILFFIALSGALISYRYGSVISLFFLIDIICFFIAESSNRRLEQTLLACESVIKENQKIAEKNTEYFNKLLTDNGNCSFLRHNKYKKYIVFWVLLPVVGIVQLSNINQTLQHSLLILAASSVMLVFVRQRIKFIFECCRSIMGNNSAKIYSEKKISLQNMPVWSYYEKRWKFFLGFFILSAIITNIFALLVSSKLAYDLSNSIIVFSAAFIMLFSVSDIKQVIDISLGILKLYDDFIKKRFQFCYNPDKDSAKIDKESFMESPDAMIAKVGRDADELKHMFSESKSIEEHTDDIKRKFQEIKYILKNFIKFK